MKFPLMRRKAYDLLRKEKKQIDWLMWFAGLIGPASTLPQVYEIFVSKEVAGISLLSWLLYILTSTVSLLYAVVHRLKIFIITNFLWIVVEAVIVIGVLLYE